jgi:hypothetical protein
MPFVHFIQHTLKAGPVERRTGNAVVHKKPGILKAMLGGESLKHGFLVGYAVAVSLERVVATEPAVQGCYSALCRRGCIQ